LILDTRDDIVRKYKAARVSGERMSSKSVGRDKREIQSLIEEKDRVVEILSTGGADVLASTIQAIAGIRVGSVWLHEINGLKELAKKETHDYEKTFQVAEIGYFMFNLEKLLVALEKRLISFFESKSNYYPKFSKRCFDNKIALNRRRDDIERTFNGQVEMVVDLLKVVEGVYNGILNDAWNATRNGKFVKLPLKHMKAAVHGLLSATDIFKKTSEIINTTLLQECACMTKLVVMMSAGKKGKNKILYQKVDQTAKECLDVAENVIRLIKEELRPQYNVFKIALNAPVALLMEEIDGMTNLYESLSLTFKTLQHNVKKASDQPDINMTSTRYLTSRTESLKPYLKTWERVSKLDIYDSYGVGNATRTIRGAKEEQEYARTNLKLILGDLNSLESYSTKLTSKISDSVASRGNHSWHRPEDLGELSQQTRVHSSLVRALVSQLQGNDFVQKYEDFVGSLLTFHSSLQLTGKFYR
jgi:hypothetical protein